MSDFVFHSHEEWQASLDKVPFEQALAQLIAQLESAFSLELLDHTLLASLDGQFLSHYQVVPLCFHQSHLFFGYPGPFPTQALEGKLSHQLGCGVIIVPYRFEEYPLANNPDPLPFSAIPAEVIQHPEPSVSQTFQNLLIHARQVRASDIHLEPQQDQSILVRFRVDGLLHDIETLHSSEFHYSRRLISKIKVSADLDIAETRVPQDGRITELIQSEPVDLRVSTLPSLHGEKVVIRLLPHKNPFQELRDLGFDGEALLTYYNWIKSPQGMVLITGQTGSGKTSTLYTTLSHLLNAEKNVVTIEDPIEYQLKGITQVQVHPKVGLTFASGLRSILRQDPDTILLGEIRDPETAEIAYQAALTGHLVLSTLHTNDAPSAIIRLIDIQVEPYLIASATLGVVAQRLIRRVCSHCVQPYTPALDLLRSLGLDANRREYTFSRAVGCEHCFHTGYYGREGIFEVMPVDDALAGLISQKKQLSEIRAHLQQQKVQSLFDSAVAKVEQGITTVEEIYRVVPPTQHSLRSRATGSVFVFMLFLISILSILILNMANLFEGKSSLLHLQKQALQGNYATYSALELAKADLFNKLDLDHLYWAPKGDGKSMGDPLTQVAELQSLLNQTQTYFLIPGLNTQAHIQVSRKAPPVGGVSQYTYQIQGQSKTASQPVSPAQLLTGMFQTESGTLPLSFFERFAAAGTITETPGSQNTGPWYSPTKPVGKLPLHGYLTQSMNLPQSIWPVIGDVSAEATQSTSGFGLGLTPISSGVGATYWLGSKDSQPKAFDPSQSSFALSVHGNIDRLELNAPDGNTQQLELSQIAPGQSDTPLSPGYQKYVLTKTLVEDLGAARTFKVSIQQVDLTLNPQKQIVSQRQMQSSTETFAGNFSGLVLVYGNITQLTSQATAGQNAYSRPLSIFANTDIGLSSSLLSVNNSKQAILGVVSQDGAIHFQPLQELPLADWAPSASNTQQVQAALIAGDFKVPETQSVLVNGSVANLKGAFPAGIKTISDARLHHLAIAPPFFPRVNPDSVAVLITQAPAQNKWQERRQ